MHPFQTFILGQKNFPPQLAKNYGIDLVFYGENEAEYGNPIADNADSLRDKSFHTTEDLKSIFLAGEPIKKIMEEYSLNLNDLMPYLPIPARNLHQRTFKYIILVITSNGYLRSLLLFC